jgi:hypothetical protein
VPADLPPYQARTLARTMLDIHADFRRRHGLPALPTAWTLPDFLHELRGRSLLTDPTLLGSRRPGLGGALTRMRLVLWNLLKPLFFRQSEVNRDVVLALEALARDHEHALHVQRALTSRIAELETAVAELDRRAR